MFMGMFIVIVVIMISYRFIRWMFNGLIALLPVTVQETIRRVGHFVLAFIALMIILSAGGFI